MTSSFMSKEELIELTDRQLPSKQIEWLKKNGWKYAISAACRPKVSRDYFNFKMGTAIDEPNDCALEPDFSHWIKKHGNVPK